MNINNNAQTCANKIFNMKFQPSAIAATNLSKKSGGTVATITNTFRRKSNPRQPRTPKQTAGRARLVSLSTGWGVLTASQQDAWIAAAPNFVFFKNGEAYTLKGNTLYQKINNNLLRAGSAAITLPPLPVAFPNVSIASIDVEHTTDVMHITFTGATSTPAGFAVIAVATPCFKPGKRFVTGKLRELGSATITTSVANILSLWSAYPGMGTLVTGMRIELGFYLISTTTGQASQIQTMQTVVIAGS